ncbi:hypothetical protein [Saccharopolyspora rosea]|uniref:hypothetical protein n=1 Tax=Saccharopolyspora rosea TaxID=524884 RepID=UPI0021D89922|nr:hypothetical protein [Saccharopolyspora rosea]
MAPVQFIWADLPMGSPGAVITEREGYVYVVADPRLSGDELANVLHLAEAHAQLQDAEHRDAKLRRRRGLGVVGGSAALASAVGSAALRKARQHSAATVTGLTLAVTASLAGIGSTPLQDSEPPSYWASPLQQPETERATEVPPPRPPRESSAKPLEQSPARPVVIRMAAHPTTRTTERRRTPGPGPDAEQPDSESEAPQVPADRPQRPDPPGNEPTPLPPAQPPVRDESPRPCVRVLVTQALDVRACLPVVGAVLDGGGSRPSDAVAERELAMRVAGTFVGE